MKTAILMEIEGWDPTHVPRPAHPWPGGDVPGPVGLDAPRGMVADRGVRILRASDAGYLSRTPAVSAGTVAHTVPGLPWPNGAPPTWPAPVRTTRTRAPSAAGPDIYWPPRITAATRENTLMERGEIPEDPEPRLAEVELLDAEGALDGELAYQWRGRPIRLWIVRDGMQRPWVAGHVARLGWGRRGWRIQIRPHVGLDARIDPGVYTGTGAGEGDAALEGAPRPMVWGVVRSASPVLVGAADLLYQAHAGRCLAIDVRDAGIALASASPRDYPTVSELLAATTGHARSGAAIEAGQYATCLAEGYMRLAAAPAGVVTADVRAAGHPRWPGLTIADIVQGVLARYGGADLRVDTDTMNALRTAAPTDAGIVIDETLTVEALCRRLLAGIGVGVSIGARGEVRTPLLDPPHGDQRIDAIDVAEIERIEAAPPAWRRVMTYRRRWRPLTEQEIAAGVTVADREELGAAHRELVVTDYALLDRDPTARDARSVTYLDDKAAVAGRLVAMQRVLGRGVDVWEVTVLHRLAEWIPGAGATVTWPRWGLRAGLAMMIQSVEEDAYARRSKLVLRSWGATTARGRYP